MRRPTRLLAALLVGLLCACGAATPGVVLLDETLSLDRPRLEAAAAPLVNEGITVAVVVARRGSKGSSDFLGRLGERGLTRGDGLLQPQVAAVYVSLEPRYSELRVGSRLSALLPAVTLESIRAQHLNPELQERRFDRAAEAAVSGIATEYFSARNQVSRLRHWVLGTIFGGLALWLFWLVGRDLVDSNPNWPVVRWSRELWARTPPGRREEARREKARRASSLRALKRVQEEIDATGSRPGLLLPGELAERRRDLDARADVALDVAEQDPTEFEPVRYLVSDYEILHRDMREVALLTGTLASSASRAEKTFAGLKAAARAPRGKRWKKSGCVSGEVRKSLETLGDRLAALDTERSALEPGADRPDLLARVRDLEQRYRALDGEVRDLWQRELPESWKARKVDVPRQWPIGGRRYNRPPIPDRSDTTWDSTSDFSSSGGDSHSGGDW